jgi:hypothetical protein
LDGCTSYGPAESQGELEVDNLFKEAFTYSRWETNVDRIAEKGCLNTSLN